MPVVAFSCPACGMRSSLDHYTSSACSTVIHPDYATAALHEAWKVERRGSIGVSDLLTCPRKKAIADYSDIAINPLDFNAMMTGTAWHNLLEKHSSGKVEVAVSGKIEDIDVHGEIDSITGGIDHGITIHDHKHTNDFRRRYLTEATAENKVQTSLYAELYEQTFGIRPSRGANWYHFTGSKGSESPLVVFAYDLWPLADCLAHRPFGSDFTVSDILHQLASVIADQQWQALPLVGESIQFGSKTGCSYCAVYNECHIAAKGAPF